MYDSQEKKRKKRSREQFGQNVNTGIKLREVLAARENWCPRIIPKLYLGRIREISSSQKMGRLKYTKCVMTGMQTGRCSMNSMLTHHFTSLFGRFAGVEYAGPLLGKDTRQSLWLYPVFCSAIARHLAASAQKFAECSCWPQRQLGLRRSAWLCSAFRPREKRPSTEWHRWRCSFSNQCYQTSFKLNLRHPLEYPPGAMRRS